MRSAIVATLIAVNGFLCRPALSASEAAPRLRFVKTIGDMRGRGMHNLSAAVTDSGRIYLLMESGRVAVFGPEGEYRRSLRCKTPWPPERWSLAVQGERVFLCDLMADFPFLRSPRRQGVDPGRFRGARAAVLGRDGGLVVADAGNNRVQVFADAGGDRLVATLQLPRPPTAVAVRDNRLAVLLDQREARVYRKEKESFALQATGAVGPFARAAALGPQGDLFVAFNGKPDAYALKQYRVAGKKVEFLRTVAPSFMEAWPNLFPAATPLATGPKGQVWFAARDRGAVLSLDPRTDQVSVRLTGLADPTSLCFDRRGHLLVGVRKARILEFALTQLSGGEVKPVRTWKSLYDNPLVPVWGLLCAPDGDVYVRVLEKGWRKGWPAFTLKKVGFDGDAATIIDFGPLYAKRTRFAPWEGFYSLAFDAEGNLVLVVHPLLAVLKIRPDGQVMWEASRRPRGGADSVEFEQPRDLALDLRGNIWVVDAKRNEVICLSAAGRLLTRFGGYANVDDTQGKGFDAPSGIALTTVAGDEYLYVGDAGNQRLVKYRVEYPNPE